MNPADAGGGAFLLDVLATLAAAEETPLRGGIDAAGIAAWALEREEIRSGRRPAWADLRAGADAALAALLPGAPVAAASSAAGWIDRLHAALRAAHPQSATVLSLLAAGHDPRAVASRLALGLRLVDRVRREISLALEGSRTCSSA